MAWLVLNNCEEVETHIDYVIPFTILVVAYDQINSVVLMFKVTIIFRIYKKKLENDGCCNVEKTLKKQFSAWF